MDTSIRYTASDAQVALYPGPATHIQVAGPKGNRSYGFALTVEELSDELMEASQARFSLTSLANTDRQYIPVSISASHDGSERVLRFDFGGNFVAEMYVNYRPRLRELFNYVVNNFPTTDW